MADFVIAGGYRRGIANHGLRIHLRQFFPAMNPIRDAPIPLRQRVEFMTDHFAHTFVVLRCKADRR
jgi:hypothetical protein